MLCQLKNLTSNGGTDTGCDRQEAHTHHVLARLIRVGATTRIVTIVCATLSSHSPRTSSRSALFPPPLYRLGLRAELNLNFKHLPGSQTIHSNLIIVVTRVSWVSCVFWLCSQREIALEFFVATPPAPSQVLCLPSWAALKLCFIRKSILMRLYSAQLRDIKAGSVSLIRRFIIKCTASNYKSEPFKIYIFKILEPFFSIVKRISIIEY